MTSQTSLQALRIYRQALNNPDTDLAVSSTGNVRVATLIDRAIHRIADFFNTNSIEQRREQAKHAIRAKFESEVRFLGKDLSEAQQHAICGTLNKLIAGEDFEKVSAELKSPAMSAALRHIRDASDIGHRKELEIAWKVTAERIADGKAPDMAFASKLARLTRQWKRELHVDDSKGYQLAKKTAALQNEYKGLNDDDARSILQLSNRLHTRFGLPANRARTLAIDMLVPLRKSGVGLHDLERALKTVMRKLPELANYSAQTRISAALCYVQLLDASSSVKQPLEEVKQRLADLKAMQSLMPRGCVIDQIHQGCHVRGKTKLDREGLEALSNSAASLATADQNVDGRVFEFKVPDNFRRFGRQFVKDIVRDRNLEIELKHNGLPDAEFASIEKRRRERPERLPAQDYADWARRYQNHAGSEDAAGTLSRLQSQTSFADIETVCLDRMKNADGYTTRAYGEPFTSRVQFVADRRDDGGEALMKLQTRILVDAKVLDCIPATSEQDPLPHAQVAINLLSSKDWLPALQRPIASMIRDCVASIPVKALDEGSTAARMEQLVVTWDLVPDWNAWMKERAPIL